MENYFALIISVVALLISILTWFIEHRLTKKRDIINKQRDIRITYLRNAWQTIEHISNRSDITEHKDLEKAIADIQLFGTSEQIEYTRELTKKYCANKDVDLSQILNDLRNELRNELGLTQIDKSVFSLRFKNLKSDTKVDASN